MICRYTIRCTVPCIIALVLVVSLGRHTLTVIPLSARISDRYTTNSTGHSWYALTTSLGGVKNAVYGTSARYGILLRVAYTHAIYTRYMTGTLNLCPSSMSISIVNSTSILIEGYYYEHSYGLY